MQVELFKLARTIKALKMKVAGMKREKMPPLQPGTIVKQSDRSYIVMPSGEWRRYHRTI